MTLMFRAFAHLTTAICRVVCDADYHERKAWSDGFMAGQDALVEYVQSPIVSAADGVPALNPQENR